MDLKGQPKWIHYNESPLLAYNGFNSLYTDFLCLAQSYEFKLNNNSDLKLPFVLQEGITNFGLLQSHLSLHGHYSFNHADVSARIWVYRLPFNIWLQREPLVTSAWFLLPSICWIIFSLSASWCFPFTTLFLPFCAEVGILLSCIFFSDNCDV